MGRPIKKIFIGERGAGAAGGEGLASVTITNGGTTYADGTLVISAPDLVGGVQAEGTYTQTAGVIDAYVITVAGSGYTSPPTVAPSDAGAGDAVLAGVLTTGTAAVIAATAYVATANESADIIAQKGTTAYRVETATDGVGECSLVASVPNAVGEMAIVATDSAGGTYYVMKLYNNTVYIVKGAGTGTQFADGVRVEWAKDGTAVLNESVKITS